MTYFNGHSAGGVDYFCCYTPQYVPWAFSGRTLIYRFSDQIDYQAAQYALFSFPGPIEGVVQLDNFSVNESLYLTISSVPEPATWWSLILGFAAVGFAIRKRKIMGTGSLLWRR